METKKEFRGHSEFRPCDAQEVKAQIGRMNILAISGGRVGISETGIELPVSSGYRVMINLDWNDTYTVQRILVRKGVATLKGAVEGVYCDEVGEVAYQASCYKNVKFGEEG